MFWHRNAQFLVAGHIDQSGKASLGVAHRLSNQIKLLAGFDQSSNIHQYGSGCLELLLPHRPEIDKHIFDCNRYDVQFIPDCLHGDGLPVCSTHLFHEIEHDLQTSPLRQQVTIGVLLCLQVTDTEIKKVPCQSGIAGETFRILGSRRLQ